MGPVFNLCGDPGIAGLWGPYLSSQLPCSSLVLYGNALGDGFGGFFCDLGWTDVL